MGTRFELVIAGASAPRDQWAAVAEAALDAVSEWHARLNRFDPGSFVSWLRGRAPADPVAIDEDLLGLLALCGRVWRGSGGAFDPAGGRFGDVRLDHDARTLTFAGPGVELDFGAVAKGYALDAAADVLRSLGVTSALIHGGTSTVVAIGAPPEGVWRVQVADAGPVVELHDRAISVSRNDDPAQRPGHVVDPRTGDPAIARAVAAVLGPTAAPTDAWSTAMLVLADRPGSLDADLTTILPEIDGRWRVEGPDAPRVCAPRAVPE